MAQDEDDTVDHTKALEKGQQLMCKKKNDKVATSLQRG